jgi:ABC-type phosphate transport system auxiliary subunit
MGVGAESTGGGAQELERITARLEQLATQLEGDVDDEHAAELVREASELASEAGRAVEGALRGTSGSPGD